MKKQHFLFGIAIIILIAVLADLYLWFAATSTEPNFYKARGAYLNHYPESWRNARWLTAVSILLLTASGLIFLNLRNSSRALRVTASILGMVCAVLIAWQLFSLM